MTLSIAISLLSAAATAASPLIPSDIQPFPLSTPELAAALRAQGVPPRSDAAIETVEPLFEHAVGAQLTLEDAGRYSGTVVGQDAVEIALGLDLDPRAHYPVLLKVVKALARDARTQGRWKDGRPASQEWKTYFQQTANLESDRRAAELFAKHGFFPVKISWEDIGRDVNSAWGSRISDVGIWGRETKEDLASARLMLTVRRDENFRDKVLMVPSDNIKLHRRRDGRLEEVTLRQRLAELGLLSASGRFDKNVIVSNQFSIVPVPQKEHVGVDTLSFNFSIYPYGSTNYVIADTIEGSSELVVGGHSHQLVYFNANGKKAPFTAARASDRQEIVKAAEEMRKAGLDVDVQRFYLIQIPIKHEARGVTPANMGEPPVARMYWGGYDDVDGALGGGGGGLGSMATAGAPANAKRKGGGDRGGLEQVVVGHGEEEGEYRVGSGFRGQRADERIRVTVCYFVTPRGELTDKDMSAFAAKFKEWDQQAVWGGSFVVPEPEPVASK